MNTATKAPPKPTPLTDAVWLDCAAIEPNPYQPRTRFDEAELAPLIADIEASGAIDSPVTVRPIECDERLTDLQIRAKRARGIYYQLVFGERRLLATMRAGKDHIPARVRELNDLRSAEKALKENTERAPLTDAEEARAMLRYWDAWKADEGRDVSQNEMIKRFGKRVVNLKKLLDICEVNEALKPIAENFNGVISSVLLINEQPRELQKEIVRQFDIKARTGPSFRDVETFIANHKANSRAAADAYTPPDAHTQHRAAIAAQQGSAPLSRGYDLTSSITPQQAQAAVDAALSRLISAAQGARLTLREWAPFGATMNHDVAVMVVNELREMGSEFVVGEVVER